MDYDSQHDAGHQFAHQRRLLQAHCQLAEQPGDEKQDEKDLEQFHPYPAPMSRLRIFNPPASLGPRLHYSWQLACT